VEAAMINAASSNRSLLIAALIGGLLSYGIHYLMTDDSDQAQKMASMGSRIKELEALLATAQNELRNTQSFSQTNNIAALNKTAELAKRVKDSGPGSGDQTASNLNSVQMLRNLQISPENDSRSFVERVNGLLSDNPPKEKIAIATKGIFGMAGDRDQLPDSALQAIYTNQSDPDLKRVVAQVMSQRGNDTLLEDQVAKAQAKLKSGQARERQDALLQLAKLRNVKAADAIVPLLHDPDTDVKLDALLALRNNGNALNVGSVEMLRNDPSPAVRSLANDVANDLRDLSASARTTMSNSDIEAGLPPM
jgi:hypothetical protein